MLRRSFVVSALVVAGALLACSSIPELNFVEDDGGVLLPDGAVVPRDGGDAGIDPNCKKTGVEICDDGIDNDCNGKTDCADSACVAFSCQDAPPEWTAVTFSGDSRPGCPPSTTALDLRVSAGDGTASCSCSCAPVGGSCTMGNWTVTVSSENTCLVGTTTKPIPVSSAGLCTAIPGGAGGAVVIPIGAFAQATPPGPTACNATSAVNGPITNGRLCQAAKFGKGCASNQVCAPKPVGGTVACVTKAGAEACPAGYAKRNTAGATENDQRTCTGCACAPPNPCSGGEVNLYGTTNCKDTGANSDRAEKLARTCTATTPDSNFTATHFKSTAPSGGCGAVPTSQATPGGSLTFSDPRTVCCK